MTETRYRIIPSSGRLIEQVRAPAGHWNIVGQMTAEEWESYVASHGPKAPIPQPVLAIGAIHWDTLPSQAAAQA